MALKNIRWLPAIGGAFTAEASIVAAAFVWVAFYSYLVHPGESPAFYQRYAQISSPWVALSVGIPVFYLICRWPTAIAIFAIYCAIDLPIVLLDDNPSLPGWLVALNYVAKFLACYFGGISSTRTEQPA